MSGSFEGWTPSDDFAETGEFDAVIDHCVPGGPIPFYHKGKRYEFSPANTAVRLFFGEDLHSYSRAIIYLEDDTAYPIKPDDDFMRELVGLGVPVELPDKLDETDQEFMDEYMRFWTEEVNSELESLM